MDVDIGSPSEVAVQAKSRRALSLSKKDREEGKEGWEVAGQEVFPDEEALGQMAARIEEMEFVNGEDWVTEREELLRMVCMLMRLV
jgi:hypothetical protein